MTALPLIIDCDPGVDDAIALLLALASPEALNLLGITTVAGNVPLSLTQQNALKICELAGRPEVPIFAGCPRPLLRPLLTAEHVHGTTGLEGVTFPNPSMSLQSQHGVAFLMERLTQTERPITLATLGPLTNIAVALIQEPAIANQIERIVVMGGAITQGNVTPAAEFNIYVDPHAAQVVFEAGLNLTLISLDVTHQVLTTPERLERIRAINTPVSAAAADLLAYYGTADAERYGLPGAPLHDPCVIAYLLAPHLFSGRALRVDIEVNSPLTLGQTLVDCWQSTAQPPNAQVIEQVDADGLYGLLINQLAKL
ncbi:nucleoside hydrolase [Pseudanabaena sp. FACHB-2040]|uniref:nucleoside hydrolase n=1 Tax=Pseudanabaena sp. FACHB-2040 TaxID=2692859 RepID=UPI001685F99B|nr:nucleoside hydrolase [Pseudanabaena sp. FACHB-2040]MBD2260084.1 nucleoside hydrolase [Pseudanabaena sp. FACHB-2040]